MGTARGRPRDNVDFLGVTFRRDVLRLQLIPLPLSTSQLQSAELPHELASTGESHSRRLCGGSGVHEQENRAHEVGGVQVDAVGTRWRTTSQVCFHSLFEFPFFSFSLLSTDLVFPLVVSGVLQPALSPNVVKKVGEKYSLVRDLNGKLRLL
ncbi:hypothetical protein AAZX31_19G149200 [Glycine max]|uniref:Uncharacterized protein n=1 Tax=Glycine max TaxID=3847 RepID=K7MYN9_SOYBN|nr:hypothetical protein GLYMA_19G163100v4 [Glycine max]